MTMHQMPNKRTAERVSAAHVGPTSEPPRNRAAGLVRAPLLAIAIIALAGCSASTVTPPAASVQGPSAPVPSVSQTLASATASATVAPQLIECLGGTCPKVVPGAYVTGAGGFFPGLAIDIPADWDLVENSTGELAVSREDRPDNKLLLWKDIRAVVSNHRSAPEGTLLKEVAGTPDAIVGWLTTNPDFAVIEQAKPATIAGISGTVLTVGVSETADFGEPGCPSNPRCADFFSDPAHWGTVPYGVGGAGPLRLFVATLPYPNGDHLFALVWEGSSTHDLQAFSVLTQPILDSIKVPDQFVSN